MATVWTSIARVFTSIIGKPQIDPNDGIDTISERMIPGSEVHEQIKWLSDRLMTSGCLAGATFSAIVFPIIRLPLSIAILIYVLFSLVQHLNTLLTAKTWAVLSWLIQSIFYLIVLIALL